MGFDTIIKNGSVVTATDTYVADIAIANGKITAVGTDLPAENATKILDASGKLILPGGIDVHTHLDMPFGGTTSADDFETGTRAAAFGGTTTLIDFAIQYKGQTLRQATRDLGVDVLSFGGTKNGIMGGEAVVFFNPKLSNPKLSADFLYLRKQGMQLASKMRFIAAQFEALLTNDLWRRSAEHATRAIRGGQSLILKTEYR